MPITRKIVDKVAAVAETESMPSGLKIVSKTNNILYDLAWIAGVDITNEVNDNDNINKTDNVNEAEKINQDKMHPDDIEGLALTKHQENNQSTNNEIVKDVQDQADDNEEIEIVFEPYEEAEEDEEDPEEDEESDPEDDRLIRTRSGQVSRPVYKYVTTHQG